MNEPGIIYFCWKILMLVLKFSGKEYVFVRNDLPLKMFGGLLRPNSKFYIGLGLSRCPNMLGNLEFLKVTKTFIFVSKQPLCFSD